MQVRTSKTMIYGDEGWWKVADWDEGWLYSWGGAQPFQLEDPACGEQRPGALFAISNKIKMNNVYSLFQKMEAEVMENNQSFICLPKVLKPKLLNSENSYQAPDPEAWMLWTPCILLSDSDELSSSARP